MPVYGDGPNNGDVIDYPKPEGTVMHNPFGVRSMLVTSVLAFAGGGCASDNFTEVHQNAEEGEGGNFTDRIGKGDGPAALSRSQTTPNTSDLMGGPQRATSSMDGTANANILALTDRGTPDGTFRGARLMPGEVLVGSVNEYLSPEFAPAFMMNYLFMQTDGNLVVYQRRQGHPGDAAPYWSIGTVGWTGTGTPFYYARMNEDGDLVLYANGVGYWNTLTFGNPGSYLEAQPNGDFVIKRPDGRVIWATQTAWFGPTGGGGGGGGGGSDDPSHPGCQFSRTDVQCALDVMLCNDIWVCGWDDNGQPREVGDGLYECGICVSGARREEVK